VLKKKEKKEKEHMDQVFVSTLLWTFTRHEPALPIGGTA
jgi:hypothetical protein